jgi:hypothetical protein
MRETKSENKPLFSNRESKNRIQQFNRPLGNAGLLEAEMKRERAESHEQPKFVKEATTELAEATADAHR